MSCDCNSNVSAEEVFGCEINLLNKPFLNNPSVNDLIYILDKTDNTCKATSLEKIVTLISGSLNSPSLYTGSDTVPTGVIATITDTLSFNGGLVAVNTTNLSNDTASNPIKFTIGDGDNRHTFAQGRYYIEDNANNVTALFGISPGVPDKLVLGTFTSHQMLLTTGNAVRMGILTNGHIYVNASSYNSSVFNITGQGNSVATSTLEVRSLNGNHTIFARDDNKVSIGHNAPSEMLHVLEKVRADTGFNVNGVDGIGAIGGTTYTFGGGSSGDVASMTINAGIVSAITLVP